MSLLMGFTEHLEIVRIFIYIDDIDSLCLVEKYKLPTILFYQSP